MLAYLKEKLTTLPRCGNGVTSTIRFPRKRPHQIDRTLPAPIPDLQDVLIPGKQLEQGISTDLVASTQPNPVPVGCRLRSVLSEPDDQGPNVPARMKQLFSVRDQATPLGRIDRPPIMGTCLIVRFLDTDGPVRTLTKRSN